MCCLPKFHVAARTHCLFKQHSFTARSKKPAEFFPFKGEYGTPNEQWGLEAVPGTPYFLIKS
jgi:hypothetical protein